jgi:predicted Zn-dependent protease
VGLRKAFSTSLFAVAFLLAGCTKQNTNASSEATDLASHVCPVKVKPEVLISHEVDGDYDVQVVAPQNEAPEAQEKLYLNNQGDPTKAPKWLNNTVSWYYNSAGMPANFSKSQVLSIIQSSMNYWSSVCNIKWTYMGESTKSSEENNIDNANIVGWGRANGATGITFSYMRSTKLNNVSVLSIYESDVNLSTSDIRDTTTLRGVLNHELGHVLGLAHSDVSESIMFANPYHAVDYLLTLRQDDISGCVGLYGPANTVVMPTPTPTPAPTATPAPTPVPPAPTPSSTPAPSNPGSQGC